MTGGRPSGPAEPPVPPDWFRNAARRPPGREVSGPVRRNATPWVGQPPGAMFPAAEDATMLIQRITDEAVPRNVREAEAVVHYPDGADPVTGRRHEPGAEPKNAAAGMKTATTAGVVRIGALMAVATVVSRVTGLLSKMAMIALLSTGLSSSAYTVANTLPNIVFELLIGGVLTSVAIPLLTRAQRSDPDGGQEYTQRLLTIALIGLLVATVIAVLCAPLLARLYVSGGDTPDPQLTLLTTQLGRLLLPQIFFYGIAALFGAILNTKERFAANAWAPVLNNIVVIGVAALLWIQTHGKPTLVNGLPTHDLLILGIGTTLGIVVQALVMVPSLIRSGFRFRWRWGWDPRLTEAGGLVGWAIVYVLLSQVGVVITTRIAKGVFADRSGPTIFSYASLLFQMPYGILGVAVLTAIMPRLSRHAAAGQLSEVKDDVSLANRLSAVALLPVSAALLVLGTALSVVLFEHGHVTENGAVQIGLTIGGMAIGLVPLAITLVQMRVFYAMKDGRTPTIINGIMVAVRVPLLLASMLLEPKWVIPGLALATAVSYLVGAVVGEIWLRARFGPMGTSRLMTTIGKMVVASGVGGTAAFLAVKYTAGLTPTSFVDGLGTILLGATVGLLVIAVLATALRVEEFVPIRHRILRLLGRPAAVVTATSPAGMGGSAGPTLAMPAGVGGDRVDRGSSVSHRSERREQVTTGVTHAGTGGPRDTSDPRAPVGPFTGAPALAGPLFAPVDGPTVVSNTRGPAGGGAPNTGGLPSGPMVVLAPGATVGGRYRLVSLIGTDDAGNRFWRAKDTVLPRDMAVTLLPDTTATSATVARTLRVGRLHHIGLPQTLDVGTEQGQSYVVGQWVDGATLTDLLAGGPLEPDVATSITAKVSEAVAEAHRNGIALGAINPSLVRVNFDGQVRLSHVIAHGNATPDQDIRAVGGLLYLMLTGTWPLAAGLAAPAGDRTVKLGANGMGQLTPAPTRLGREVPANEVRRNVPAALSALAERALHPDDPAGIHAVGAIAALLRQPEAGPAAAPRAVEEPLRPALNPAERRLVKERRAKLAIATVMIAAFSALIIIVVASLAKQVLSDVAGPTVTTVQKLTIAPTTPAETTTNKPAAAPPTKALSSTTQASTAAATSKPNPPAAAVVQVSDATVYDPDGDGVKDNTDKVALAFDGNPQTFWSTWVYNQQFPTRKPGVGLTLVFNAPIVPASVTVTSQSAGSTFEIRATAKPDLPYDQTTSLAKGSVAAGSNSSPGSVKIALTNAPKSKYLVVFVTQMAPDGNKFQSDINEITVSGS